MSKHIFLTGATGFVGRNLIPRILDDDPENRLTLLVRANKPAEGQQRVEGNLYNCSVKKMIFRDLRKGSG